MEMFGGTTTTGKSARMLMEGALHAVDGEERVCVGDGDDFSWEWVKSDRIDPKSEVSFAFKALAHEMKSILESHRAINRIMQDNGFVLDMREYVAAVAEEGARFEDDWEWVYDDLDFDDMSPE